MFCYEKPQATPALCARDEDLFLMALISARIASSHHQSCHSFVEMFRPTNLWWRAEGFDPYNCIRSRMRLCILCMREGNRNSSVGLCGCLSNMKMCLYEVYSSGNRPLSG